jgi:shikimate kinase
MSVVLIGMMGVGKTTLGRQAAAAIHFRFVDLDHQVEKIAGMKVARIFEEKGEPYFRELETKALKELTGAKGIVLGAGGGAAVKEGNMDLMRAIGPIVYLRASVSTLESRLSNSKRKRPLLEGGNLDAKLGQLLAERRGTYEQSDFTIDVDLIPRLEVIEQIAKVAQGRSA